MVRLSAAGSIPFVIMALTQVLGVGTVALVSHAAGRRDQPEANLVFNQFQTLDLHADPKVVEHGQSNPTTGSHQMLYSAALEFVVHWGWRARNLGPDISR